MIAARNALVVLLAATLPGCFTTWVGVRAAGYPGATEEDVREARVPLPGVEERLVVALAPERITPSGFDFSCTARQHARDAVYRSAYRYGSRWTKTTVIMAIAEAAISGALYLTARSSSGEPDPNRPFKLLGAAFFAVDAVGTAAISFIPRKELYDRTEVPVTTPVRSVCPDGVMVEIGGETFPLDAAGGLGELGSAALDQWMQQPTGALVITFAGRSAPIDVNDNDRCTYQRARGTVPPVTCTTLPRILSAVIDIPVGTLAQVATAD